MNIEKHEYSKKEFEELYNKKENFYFKKLADDVLNENINYVDYLFYENLENIIFIFNYLIYLNNEENICVDLNNVNNKLVNFINGKHYLYEYMDKLKYFKDEEENECVLLKEKIEEFCIKKLNMDLNKDKIKLNSVELLCLISASTTKNMCNLIALNKYFKIYKVFNNILNNDEKLSVSIEEILMKGVYDEDGNKKVLLGNEEAECMLLLLYISDDIIIEKYIGKNRIKKVKELKEKFSSFIGEMKYYSGIRHFINYIFKRDKECIKMCRYFNIRGGNVYKIFVFIDGIYSICNILEYIFGFECCSKKKYVVYDEYLDLNVVDKEVENALLLSNFLIDGVRENCSMLVNGDMLLSEYLERGLIYEDEYIKCRKILEGCFDVNKVDIDKIKFNLIELRCLLGSRIALKENISSFIKFYKKRDKNIECKLINKDLILKILEVRNIKLDENIKCVLASINDEIIQ